MPGKVDVKFLRAMRRLEAGALLFELPDGGYKFGGNKFVPAPLVARLPLIFAYTNNRGWRAWRLDPQARQ